MNADSLTVLVDSEISTSLPHQFVIVSSRQRFIMEDAFANLARSLLQGLPPATEKEKTPERAPAKDKQELKEVEEKGDSARLSRSRTRRSRSKKCGSHAADYSPPSRTARSSSSESGYFRACSRSSCCWANRDVLLNGSRGRRSSSNKNGGGSP